MEALAIIEAEIPTQTADGLWHAPVIVERDFLVLDGSPQALDEDVIQRPPAPVHADLNSACPEPLGKSRAGKLGALIGIENFRLGVYERAFQGADAEVTVEGD